jgi:adenosylcobyric acid synthase
LPRISNFDDFDPLVAEPGVRLRYVDSIGRLGKPDAIILPGTKSTVNDLKWLRTRGLDIAIQKHAQTGGVLVGICGGYQMLGEVIHDPKQIETRDETTMGLGLLPIETTFAGEKATFRAKAKIQRSNSWLAALEGGIIQGYEIHMGRTQANSNWLVIEERNGEPVEQPDGAFSLDGRVWGCYIHGLFDNSNFRRAWLNDLGWRPTGDESKESDPFVASLTYLTDTVESTLDMGKLETMMLNGEAIQLNGETIQLNGEAIQWES